MKKFVYNILRFIILGIPIYIIGVCLWSLIMPQFLSKNVRNKVASYGHLFSRVKDAESTKNPDILFIGSSHSYRGFDPRVFKKHSISSFNLGSSSQSPLNTQVLLKQYLEKINPKLVVYEVCSQTLESDGVESSLDLLTNNKIDIHALQMVVKVNHLKAYNTLFYGYFRQVLSLNEKVSESEYQDGNHYIKGTGFVQSDFRKNKSEKEKVKDWDVNPKQLRAFEEILEYLKEHKISFVLVQAPVSKNYFQSIKNQKRIDDFYSGYGQYINFNGKINFNDTTDFYDSNHLNQNAVVAFNESLIKYLQEKKLVKEKY